LKPPEVDVVIGAPSAGSGTISERSSSSSRSEPDSLRIAVPFSPQAPFANWDALHEESCEEMALIMVRHFWTRSPLTRALAEEELQELISWEESNGFPQDVTTEELARIAREHFGLITRVSTDLSEESIERELRAGRPLIIPAAGRDLGNPYFSGDGPWYHMLVITGFKGDRYITNDPGTKRGENFVYRKDVLLNAVHDWTGVKEEIRQGTKSMLIIEGQAS
jgi:hypothetical protein